MGASRKLVGATFGALVATALCFGVAQASASPARAAADRFACTYAEFKECYDGCVLHYGEGTQASCSKIGSMPQCTCLP